MTDRELMQQELDALIEAARLLGATEAKKAYGRYTQEDARFEWAWHESISKHSAALRERLAKPRREWVSLTEEEVNSLWASHTMTGAEITRAIEAKLREKNT